MFQPRKVHPHSSSPTKSSLRRPGSIGGPPQPQSQPQSHPQQLLQTQPQIRTLLPSPHFEDDPIVAAHQNPRPTRAAVYSEDVGINYSEHALGEDDPNEEEDESLLQYTDEAGDTHGHHREIPVLPTSFQPFFTLIEDSVSNEHYHPTVHYIFEDDDSDVIAEAACRSLEILDPSQQRQEHDDPSEMSQSHAGEVGHGHDQDTQSRLPVPLPGVHEHYLILDIHPRGTLHQHPLASHQQQQQQLPTHPTPIIPGSSPSTATPQIPFHVTSAHSLSAEWQVLQTKVGAAPTIGDGNDDADDDEGWMLRIEGRGNTPGGVGVGGEAGVGKEREKESMEEMIERFQRRMDEIRQVLETGAMVAEE
ncbi:hypothetical protein LTR84_000363 [Exophiala bonariae]|uniref:Anaphase-promoting complex subunit 13 n=1 Tax=Exophiala bonariae TaxID=1690606 RepID=A0AAV9NUC6_9EURO|nr:hypothetical protein LTR84_000363 [Exophiala bonariae]